MKIAKLNSGFHVGEKPVEPTEENFDFTPFNLMATVGIGPVNRFAKQGVSTYLQEVTPGTYRLYGFLTANPGMAAMGVCYCMGSVKFDAKAGEITDMGVIGKPEAVDKPANDFVLPDPDGRIDAVHVGGAGPADRPAARGAAAHGRGFRPRRQVAHYFGLTITRILEMPGVLRYDRDRIVDLTAAQ